MPDAEPPTDDRSHNGAGGETRCTRSRALAALLADAEVRKAVGSAWPLYVMLVLGWEGTVSGTRDQIGEMLDEPGRNVGNWVNALEEAGIVKVERVGRRMSVELTDEHMSVAMMPDGISDSGDDPEQDGICEELSNPDRELLSLLDKARSMAGRIEIRMQLDAK